MKHVKRRARFQKHRNACCHQSPPLLQDKRRKKIHAILQETIWEYSSDYVTVKNWVTQFKRGDFSICDAPRPGRLLQ